MLKSLPILASTSTDSRAEPMPMTSHWIGGPIIPFSSRVTAGSSSPPVSARSWLRGRADSLRPADGIGVLVEGERQAAVTTT
jgi:hypothetical protein